MVMGIRKLRCGAAALALSAAFLSGCGLLPTKPATPTGASPLQAEPTGRRAEAIAEFHQAGCSAADAHLNVAFALTLEKSWADARAEYEKALALEPSSAAAKKGLQDLEVVVARTAKPPVSEEAEAH